MIKCIEAKVENVDTLLKVVGVLRRKEFDISDVSMTSHLKLNNSNLLIKLNNSAENDFYKAKAYLEKIIGIEDIKIIEEEN